MVLLLVAGNAFNERQHTQGLVRASLAMADTKDALVGYKAALRIGDQSNRAIVTTDELKPVKEAFSNNFQRIAGLGMFPIWMAQLSQEHTVACRQAEHEIVGEWFPAPEKAKQHFEAIANRSTQLLLEMAKQQGMTEEIQQRFEITRDNIDLFIKIGSEPCETAAENLFHSMIVQAWTAFEVMAADLWEAALNAHPKTLSNLSGRPWKKKAKVLGEPPEGEEQVSAKTIDLALLLKNGFDLSAKMGTVLKEKFKFDSIWAIREAYSSAFCRRNSDIKSALMDDCIAHLAAVRNVIVHKGGRADEKFLKEISGCQLFTNLKIGDPIKIHGQVVSDLVRPVFKRSIDLICAVDKWIYSGPNRKPDDAA